jgi:hypothetical protein
LRAPGVGGAPAGKHAMIVDVASAADLCDVLRRGFDEWRADAAARPLDMSDMDGTNWSLGD